MNALAIIPARGGSKRIPKKNIKSFFGQPIISYSICAAIDSECFNEVMVSTDNHEIAQVARKTGAEVPFLRSQENSNDHAMLVEVIEEVLLAYQDKGKVWEYVCCILATAPFITSSNIAKGFALLKQYQADSVIAVTRFSYPIQRALKIKNNQLEMFWPENYSIRSQDLEPAYHDAGQFYWLNVRSLLQHKKIFAGNSLPFILSESNVIDIDTQEDWELAEIKFKLTQAKGRVNEVL